MGVPEEPPPLPGQEQSPAWPGGGGLGPLLWGWSGGQPQAAVIKGGPSGELAVFAGPNCWALAWQGPVWGWPGGTWSLPVQSQATLEWQQEGCAIPRWPGSLLLALGWSWQLCLGLCCPGEPPRAKAAYLGHGEGGELAGPAALGRPLEQGGLHASTPRGPGPESLQPRTGLSPGSSCPARGPRSPRSAGSRLAQGLHRVPWETSGRGGGLRLGGAAGSAAAWRTAKRIPERLLQSVPHQPRNPL